MKETENQLQKTMKPEPYKVRCTDCNKSFTISHNDGRTKIQTKGTEHTPESRAKRMQKHSTTTCENCGSETFAVSPKTTA